MAPPSSAALLDLIEKEDVAGLQQAVSDGAQLDAKIIEEDAMIPLAFLAVTQGNLALLQLFPKDVLREACIVEGGENCLLVAVASGQSEEMIKYFAGLLDINAPSSSEWGGTCFFTAIRNNDVGQIKTLLDLGAAVNVQDDKGASPLLISVICNKPDIFSLLVNSGADLLVKDKKGDGPLHYAMLKDGQDELSDVVLKTYNSAGHFDPVKDGPSLANLAAQAGSVTGLQALRQHGVDLSTIVGDLDLAIAACVAQQCKVLLYLLREGIVDPLSYNPRLSEVADGAVSNNCSFLLSCFGDALEENQFSFEQLYHLICSQESVEVDAQEKARAKELDSSLQGVIFPANWSQLHLLYSRHRGEFPSPIGVALYHDIDVLVEYVETHPDRGKYILALNKERICIAAPAEIVLQQNGLVIEYWDTETEDGTHIYYSSPGLDQYRLDLINRVDNSAGLNFDSTQLQTKWKIMRLEKHFNKEWDEIVTQYA